MGFDVSQHEGLPLVLYTERPVRKKKRLKLWGHLQLVEQPKEQPVTLNVRQFLECERWPLLHQEASTATDV